MPERLKVTAKLQSTISLNDKWSPSLPSILERLWFQENTTHEAHPDPLLLKHPEIPISKAILKQGLKIESIFDSWNGMMDLTGQQTELTTLLPKDWFYRCSSPVYKVVHRQIINMRRVGVIDSTKHISNIKGTYRTDTGVLKAYDKPVQLLTLENNEISWFTIADKVSLEKWLVKCHSLGARRGSGIGQVLKWDIQSTDNDYTLLKEDRLMAPVPIRLIPDKPNFDFELKNWAWRPCPVEQLSYWREPCAMPLV